MGDISLRGKGRALFKKGGSAKKGILIIIGSKDKKPKGMKKGGMIKKGMKKGGSVEERNKASKEMFELAREKK